MGQLSSSLITMQNYNLAIPILPCSSINATTEFYHRLGFEGGAHALNSDYAILLRGTLELHFFTHKELVPANSFAGCYLRVLNVEDIYTACLINNLPKTGIPRMEPLEDKPWGLREFAIDDPDGNLLRIGQPIQNQAK
jgi:catechol 2,3-dioxygenase-like lactoylglutathione lyase family enzyme